MSVSYHAKNYAIGTMSGQYKALVENVTLLLPDPKNSWTWLAGPVVNYFINSFSETGQQRTEAIYQFFDDVSTGLGAETDSLPYQYSSITGYILQSIAIEAATSVASGGTSAGIKAPATLIKVGAIVGKVGGILVRAGSKISKPVVRFAGAVKSIAKKVIKSSAECFVAGTLVLMGNGFSKPIEDVKIGDNPRNDKSPTCSSITTSPPTLSRL
jgi:hypothetical protein